MIIDGKTFLNIQEAVAWLLQNNALPFQSTANYAPNTEIAKTTIINPSPADIKVGSLVLFADSKIGTVSGITSNGFMVGPEYTDLTNAIAYTTNIEVNSLGHLITTLSDGRTIDAGLIKEVAGLSFNSSRHLIASYNDGTTQDLGLVKGLDSFSINGSQHLIVTYDDGTTQDLGAIFSGNLNISGNITATGYIEPAVAKETHSASFNKNPSLDAAIGIPTVYNRFQVIGGRLSVIVNVKLTNTSAESKSIPVNTYIGGKEIPLSPELAQHIFDLKGNDCVAPASDSYVLIAPMPLVAINNITSLFSYNDKSSNFSMNLYHDSVYYQCSIRLMTKTGVTLAANEEIWICSRIVLDLI